MLRAAKPWPRGARIARAVSVAVVLACSAPRAAHADCGSGGIAWLHRLSSPIENSWTVGRVATSEEDAAFEKDEDPRPVMPSLERWGDANPSNWSHGFGGGDTSVDVLLDETSESYCDNAGPDCGQSDGTIECSLVAADACLGVVVTACTDTRDKQRGKVWVDEFFVQPVK
jgi:hypothetical protein